MKIFKTIEFEEIANFFHEQAGNRFISSEYLSHEYSNEKSSFFSLFDKKELIACLGYVFIPIHSKEKECIYNSYLLERFLAHKKIRGSKFFSYLFEEIRDDYQGDVLWALTGVTNFFIKRGFFKIKPETLRSYYVRPRLNLFNYNSYKIDKYISECSVLTKAKCYIGSSHVSMVNYDEFDKEIYNRVTVDDLKPYFSKEYLKWYMHPTKFRERKLFEVIVDNEIKMWGMISITKYMTAIIDHIALQELDDCCSLMIELDLYIRSLGVLSCEYMYNPNSVTGSMVSKSLKKIGYNIVSTKPTFVYASSSMSLEGFNTEWICAPPCWQPKDGVII